MINLQISIPDEPKTPLYNYILDLISSTDRKGSSIYVINTEETIKEIWNEIVKRNWRELNVRRFIPRELNVTNGLLYECKNGRKAISIQTLNKLFLLWVKYCDKTEDELKQRWREVWSNNILFSAHSKRQKISLPRHISPKLSYLMGWMCGDGHLKSDGKHYIVKISEKSINQLDLVLKPLFKELFGVNIPIYRRYMNGYAIQISSKPILRFFTSVLHIKVGEIPDFLSKFDKTNKKYFLRGIFDSEGYVNSSYKDSRIVISQASKDFLLKLIELFKEFNLNPKGPYFNRTILGTWYTIRFRSKTSIVNFANIIGSSHVDKVRKLQDLVIEIEKNWNR